MKCFEVSQFVDVYVLAVLTRNVIIVKKNRDLTNVLPIVFLLFVKDKLLFGNVTRLSNFFFICLCFVFHSEITSLTFNRSNNSKRVVYWFICIFFMSVSLIKFQLIRSSIVIKLDGISQIYTILFERNVIRNIKWC